jgi:hypothetical protein
MVDNKEIALRVSRHAGSDRSMISNVGKVDIRGRRASSPSIRKDTLRCELCAKSRSSHANFAENRISWRTIGLDHNVTQNFERGSLNAAGMASA